VYLTGQLSGWASPKDVILCVAGQLTVSGGTNAIVEYIGPGARSISATGKATITDMGAELGATTSMFPADERLQRLEPWPAWDGRDFLDMPVLLKSKGKTTTDDISPAGPWLRYRGHLDKFSDNMFMGATNAFSGETGCGKNVLTSDTGQSFSKIARDYNSRGIKWVVVGDNNYGEGSSREHAALSPRVLGSAAVIARSFARIHDSNLKKQGLLALTFQNPEDYDRIREEDRISLLGVADLAPGRPVTCVVSHADGTTETLALANSFSAPQLKWFRAGSALNLFQAAS
jgi:aconitate hydratase